MKTTINTAALLAGPQAKHSPGPWGVERTHSENWIGPLRRGSHKVAEIICHTDREGLKNETVSRNDANARLIAAAPELVEALQRILGMHDDAMFVCGSDDCGIVETNLSKARAALTKAGL